MSKITQTAIALAMHAAFATAAQRSVVRCNPEDLSILPNKPRKTAKPAFAATPATKAEKVPNYTPEQENALKVGYKPGAEKGAEGSPDWLAAQIGKTSRSIVAKLSKMGVYVKPAYKDKTGAAPVKKDEHADAIGAILRLTEADADSLTKANKVPLRLIAEALAKSKPIQGADEQAAMISEAHAAGMAAGREAGYAEGFAEAMTEFRTQHDPVGAAGESVEEQTGDYNHIKG